MGMFSTTIDQIKYFRFLNYWVDNPQFMDTVKTYWEKEVAGTSMQRFPQKVKSLSNTLSVLSKKEFGVIFKKVRMNEEHVHKAEKNYITKKVT